MTHTFRSSMINPCPVSGVFAFFPRSPQPMDQIDQHAVLLLLRCTGYGLLQGQIDGGSVPGLQPAQFTAVYKTVPQLLGRLRKNPLQQRRTEKPVRIVFLPKLLGHLDQVFIKQALACQIPRLNQYAVARFQTSPTSVHVPSGERLRRCEYTMGQSL